MKSYLGIDIGGSSIKYGWGNSQTGLQYFSSIPVKKKELKELKTIIESVLKDISKRFGRENIHGIGIGTPGTLDTSSGIIAGVNPNLPFWVNHDPRELVDSELEIPVLCDNDANLMALAEAHHCKKNSVLGITVGSGIGCGIVVDGKIYHGAHGYAGELGHVTAVDNGEKCNCGRLGCLEAYASVDGLRTQLVNESPQYSEMLLTQLLAIKSADQNVSERISTGQDLLCKVVANAIIWLDPEAVIFGGGAMDLGLYNIAELKSEIEKRLPALNRSKVAILHAAFGNKAGVMGALNLFELQ